MEEIDLENIVGRRTRGKKIDYTKEAQKPGNNDIEEDDDEDDDFVTFPINIAKRVRLLRSKRRNSMLSVFHSVCLDTRKSILFISIFRSNLLLIAGHHLCSFF
jgi:hypothetical protein